MPTKGATYPVDDCETFLDANATERKLSECCEGENLFHNCAAEGGTSGVPSAFVVPGRSGDGQPLLHCFACETTYFILPTHSPPLYECNFKLTADYPKKPEIHQVMMESRKMTVLDIVCGGGKTHIASLFAGAHPVMNILASAARRSICMTLTDRFNENSRGVAEFTCYTNIKGAGEAQSQQWKRSCVCLNSVVRIPDDIMDASVSRRVRALALFALVVLKSF